MRGIKDMKNMVREVFIMVEWADRVCVYWYVDRREMG